MKIVRESINFEKNLSDKEIKKSIRGEYYLPGEVIKRNSSGEIYYFLENNSDDLSDIWTAVVKIGTLFKNAKGIKTITFGTNTLELFGSSFIRDTTYRRLMDSEKYIFNKAWNDPKNKKYIDKIVKITGLEPIL